MKKSEKLIASGPKSITLINIKLLMYAPQSFICFYFYFYCKFAYPIAASFSFKLIEVEFDCVL